MPFLAIAAVLAIAEVFVFIWVGSEIGLGWALLMGLATALLGSYLVKRAGVSTWGRIRRKWAEGRLPGRELIDGAAILVAGAFLISPGFITDLLGFALLVPAVRTLLYVPITRRLSSRVTVIATRRGHAGPIGDVIDVEDLGDRRRQIP